MISLTGDSVAWSVNHGVVRGDDALMPLTEIPRGFSGRTGEIHRARSTLPVVERAGGSTTIVLGDADLPRGAARCDGPLSPRREHPSRPGPLPLPQHQRSRAESTRLDNSDAGGQVGTPRGVPQTATDDTPPHPVSSTRRREQRPASK